MLAVAFVGSSKKEEDADKRTRTVINDLDLARRTYTAKYLYVRESWRQCCNDTDDPLGKTDYLSHVALSRAGWAFLDEGTKLMWEAKARAHLEIQPSIKGLVVASLLRNPRRAWRGIKATIGYWCNHSTI